MIPFTDYAKISNNYCLCYFGRSTEYLVQLMQLMPFIQSKLPELNIYLCSKDEDFDHISSRSLSIKRSELAAHKHNLAYVKELVYDGTIHPILSIMNELEIKNYVVQDKEKPRGNNCCVVLKNAHYPTVDLNQSQLNQIERIIRVDGYEIVNTDINLASWVIGVECPKLFKAAESGTKTTLISTGVGQDLFKKMYPFCNVISI